MAADLNTSRTLPHDWADQFRPRLLERVEVTLDLIRAWSTGNDPSQAEALQTAVHNLGGVAGALGHARISECARIVDSELVETGRTDPVSLRNLTCVLEAELTR